MMIMNLRENCIDFFFVISVMQFFNEHISAATIDDAAAITALLNSAYRGDSSKKGWTTEAGLIEGNTRTDETELVHVMQAAGSLFLKYTGDDNKLVGCVNLQKHGKKVYLGMFSVSPVLQGGGVGKQLLLAAEEHTRQINCSSIYMSVISVRTELINWYMRHGYKDTGERKPFVEDEKSGRHVQPLEFMILEKLITPLQNG